ncbi:MAG: AraC family transcriptional regulator [Halioglobus sp.]
MQSSKITADKGFNQYRGIYLKRIPTYSFPLILDVMEELGIEGSAILKNTALERSEVAQEGTLISYIQALKLMRNILARSPRPDIGLLIGSRYQINTYGVLGYAMMSCPTWGDALRLARHYHKVASSLCNIEMEIDEDRQTLTYIATPFYPEMVDIEPFTVEKLFASLISVTKPLLAEPGYPTKVSFAYPEPDYSESYRDLFKCPVEFNTPGNRFELDLKVQQQPLLLANTMSAEIGRKMCAEFMSRQELESQQMKREVTELLLATPGQMPSMEAVAEKLNIGSRTLRRNLLAENTTFQDIVDQLRQDLSRHYLKRSQLNLDSIAQLVGFTETTNFRRAFKRWEGVPPAQYRRAHISLAGNP